MAIPAGVMRMVMFGTLPSGEIWESGFWLAGDLPTSDDEAESQCEIIWGVLVSESDPPVIPELASKFLAVGGSVRGMRCYVYPTGGPNATYIGEYTAPAPVAGAGPSVHPDQVCCVVTLLTGSAGRTKRGRMYMPAGGATMTAGAQIFGTDCQDLANDWAAAFSDLNTGSAGQPVVVSTKASSYRPITSVRVDTKPDIQRRRANKVVATSSYIAAVTTP